MHPIRKFRIKNRNKLRNKKIWPILGKHDKFQPKNILFRIDLKPRLNLKLEYNILSKIKLDIMAVKIPMKQKNSRLILLIKKEEKSYLSKFGGLIK
jgi:hypothetical protein